ncbi:MAG: hypothetical protein IPG23_17385 [Burkholderiales bacterium]|nr:hypothetical protein [Burkholderiales bacterium]
MSRHLPASHASPPRHSTTRCAIGLVCELDYEGASGDGWNEPRESADATLCEAFCGDVDIVELLSDDQRREIELAFLEQEPEFDVCDEPAFEE